MPSVRPRISWLPLADLSQTPSCIRSVFSGSRRASAMISPITSSTTLRVLEYGALKTAMPALGGAGQVDLVGADAEAADRQQVGGRVQHARRDVGVGADAEQLHAAGSASTSSSSEREPARSSTSWPRASSVSTATGWMFSRSSTFTRQG